MKIALVVHDHDPGYGQGRYTVELASRLAKDHDVHVYANRFGAPLQPNVTYQRVPAVRASAMLTILSFVRAAESLLKRQRYDIVHAQGLTCWRANVITAHICNSSRRNIRSQTLKSRMFADLSGRLERSFYKANRDAKIIGVSNLVSGEIHSACNTREGPSTLYHGVDCNHFRPVSSGEERSTSQRQFNLSAGAWQWLFVGESVKGLAQVIHQLPRFPSAQLLVVSRSEIGPYERLARSLNVSERIRFHGPESLMHLVYRAADVLVYPSPYDAFGMVVAEAMASGLPVIASRSIGAAEWIDDGHNGLLCDPASDTSLCGCLEKLHRDPHLARKLAEAARATALQHTWDDCAQSTLGIYEQVLKRGVTSQ